MRSAPTLQISVTRYGIWRTFVLLLAGSACASLIVWWWLQPAPVARSVSAVAAIGVLASLACAAGLWRARPSALRWDRQHWHLVCGSAAEQTGELAVAIDLGAWMLVRFAPESAAGGPSRRWRPAWIALQRRGLEAHWPTLRCALYSARAALLAGAVPPPSDKHRE